MDGVDGYATEYRTPLVGVPLYQLHLSQLWILLGKSSTVRGGGSYPTRNVQVRLGQIRRDYGTTCIALLDATGTTATRVPSLYPRHFIQHSHGTSDSYDGDVTVYASEGDPASEHKSRFMRKSDPLQSSPRLMTIAVSSTLESIIWTSARCAGIWPRSIKVEEHDGVIGHRGRRLCGMPRRYLYLFFARVVWGCHVAEG